MNKGLIAALACCAFATITLMGCGEKAEAIGPKTLPGITLEKAIPILEQEGFVLQESSTDFMKVLAKDRHTVQLYIQDGSRELVNIAARTEAYQEPDEIKSFLFLVASLPIDGVDQETIRRWVDAQYETPDATLHQQISEHMTVEYVLRAGISGNGIEISPAVDAGTP